MSAEAKVSAEAEHADDRFVIGIDFGTLSGRAVVVRVSDGAELGSAVHEYPHARAWTSALPRRHRAAAGLGAAGARRLRRRAARRRCPRRCAAAGVDPADGHRHRHRLHRLHDGARRSPTAPRCASCRSSPTARTPTSSCGSTTPPSRRPTGSTRSRAQREEPWLPRYGGLISSEWEFAKGLQLLEEDPELYARDGPLGRGRRLDRLAADRPLRPQRLHRRLQGHLPGRRLPVRGLPRRAQPRLRRLRRGQGRRTRIGQLGERAGAADRRRPPPGPACPRASRSPSATSTRTSPRPAARAVEPGQMVAIMGTSTCHVMNGDRAATRSRACAGSSTAASSPGSAGYEAGQSGVGDIFGWFVEHGVPPAYHEAARRARARHPRAPDRAGRRPGRSASTGWSRSTGTAATARCWSTTSSPALVVGQTLATRAEDIYRALLEATAFGTRMIIEAFVDAGVPGHRVRRRRRPAEEPAADADLRRRAPTCRCPRSAPTRARRSARRSTPRSPPARYPDVRAAARGDGPVDRARLPADRRRRRRPTTCSSPSTRRCTTTSAAAATTSCTGCARCAARPRPADRRQPRDEVDA